MNGKLEQIVLKRTLADLTKDEQIVVISEIKIAAKIETEEARSPQIQSLIEKILKNSR